MTVRFFQKRYTEADVLALYMKYREENIGPFIREVGDFIAHNKRNQGGTLKTTVFMFSQLAFFKQYQSMDKVPINFLGVCPWWLRSWFLGNIADEPISRLKQISGLGKKDLVKEVKTWFRGDGSYPVELICMNPGLFFALVEHFSKGIKGQVVFSKATVKKELSKMLTREGIPLSEVTPIIVATSVLLQGKSIEIIKGFTASISLRVNLQKIVHNTATGMATRYPDGNLRISVSTQNDTGDGMVSVGLDFLDTGVDTEEYFCRSFIEVDDYGLVKLNIPNNLVFERSADKMVHNG